eukprot:TRINITY_DN32093_c0_g1_i1.p1 TRINITY_DN32093_c0_g1~~TRINITY_DN32093_c0_g1_i1.p1  ORF type:complete len:394 (+),score=96.39 TRINITY_DN32093_c0_g1_i1:69-1250(+)
MWARRGAAVAVQRRYASAAAAPCSSPPPPVGGSGGSDQWFGDGEGASAATAELGLELADYGHPGAGGRLPAGGTGAAVLRLAAQGQPLAAEGAMADAEAAGVRVSGRALRAVLEAASAAGDDELVQRTWRRIAERGDAGDPAAAAPLLCATAPSLAAARRRLAELGVAPRQRGGPVAVALLGVCARAGDAAGAEAVVSAHRRELRGNDRAAAHLLAAWAAAGDGRAAEWREGLRAAGLAPPFGPLSCAAALDAAAALRQGGGGAAAATGGAAAAEELERLLARPEGPALPPDLESAAAAGLRWCAAASDPARARRIAAAVRSWGGPSAALRGQMLQSLAAAGVAGGVAAAALGPALRRMAFPRDMRAPTRTTAAFGAGTTRRDWWTALRRSHD